MSADTATLTPRAALPLPAAYRAPAPGLESIVTKVFGKTFGIADVGVDDDFYDLGGDSLLGEQLSMGILQATGATYQVSWFFEDGTPAKVAARIGAQNARAHRRPPLFMVHGRDGYSSPKPAFRRALPADLQLEIFELPGLRNEGPSLEGIEEIAAAYVGRLVATYPAGPIHLGSFCNGAFIAVEMAHQLQAMGRSVEKLVLMDPGRCMPLERRHRRELAKAGLPLPSARPSERWRDVLRVAAWSVVTLPVLGRVFDGSSEQDFTDKRLRRLRATVFYLRDRARRLVRPADKRTAGFSLVARSRLLAAYRHYWPRPLDLPVHVLSSAGRANSFDHTGFWARVLPHRSVVILDVTHSEVISASSPVVAAAMQSIFDGTSGVAMDGIAAEGAPPVAPAHAVV